MSKQKKKVSNVLRQNEKEKFVPRPSGASTSRKEAREKKPAGDCELCGAKADLVHHKDEDPFNNDLSNLERLCKSCHHLRHHCAPERLLAMRAAREEFVRLIKRHQLIAWEVDLSIAYARRKLGMTTQRRVVPKTLPKIMPEHAVASLFAVIDKAGNLTHQVMFRLMLYTGVRVSELVSIKLSDLYIKEGKIFIEQGKGAKDRYVLIPDRFRLTLKAYVDQAVAEKPGRVFLFQSRQSRSYSTRRIGQMLADYSKEAEIPHVHPHLLRHQALTHLTKEGLSDSQIQLLSGHSSKGSLAKYQHLALGDVSPAYNEAMKKVEL